MMKDLKKLSKIKKVYRLYFDNDGVTHVQVFPVAYINKRYLYYIGDKSEMLSYIELKDVYEKLSDYPYKNISRYTVIYFLSQDGDYLKTLNIFKYKAEEQAKERCQMIIYTNLYNYYKLTIEQINKLKDSKGNLTPSETNLLKALEKFDKENDKGE